MARSWGAPETSFNRLFRRCLECPTNVTPSCPSCPEDSICTLKPQTCDACPAMVCLPVKGINGIEAAHKPVPIAAIIGGVVGGVVIMILLTLLLSRFCARRKKKEEAWIPPEKAAIAREPSEAALSRAPSIASTVMTRASNVIQIAYIPGVTVRSAPQSPEIPPPMPAIPSTYAGTSTQTSPEVEQHFFMPKDLRDSVWSDSSSVMTDPRISIAPSLARTTMYQENVEVPPIPAQYAYRAQASAVSVRSGSNTPSINQVDATIPPVPKTIMNININASSIVARNVVAKPIEVKKSGQSLGSNLVKKSASRRATPVPTISDEKEVVFSSPSSTVMSDSPLLGDNSHMQQSSTMSVEGMSVSGMTPVSPAEGPLSSSAPSGRPTTAYTQAMIHEAMLRAVQDTSHGIPSSILPRPELAKHDSGPFSDVNEIK